MTILFAVIVIVGLVLTIQLFWSRANNDRYYNVNGRLTDLSRAEKEEWQGCEGDNPTMCLETWLISHTDFAIDDVKSRFSISVTSNASQEDTERIEYNLEYTYEIDGDKYTFKNIWFGNRVSELNGSYRLESYEGPLAHYKMNISEEEARNIMKNDPRCPIDQDLTLYTPDNVILWGSNSWITEGGMYWRAQGLTHGYFVDQQCNVNVETGDLYAVGLGA